MKKRVIVLGVSAFALATLVVPAAAYAATTANSQLSQSITAGVLSTDIRDASNVVVASPSFALSAVAASTSQQTSTGTFGTASQRISVDNPGGANGGWTLALNGTVPASTKWTSGGNNYLYNGTATTGQLTVNPAAGTITAVTGGATGVTKGASAAFSGGTPITLMTAANTAAPIWNGYITGIGLSQTIPAAQAVGTYTLDLTQTVTAP